MSPVKIKIEPHPVDVKFFIKVNEQTVAETKTHFVAMEYATAIWKAFEAAGIKAERVIKGKI